MSKKSNLRDLVYSVKSQLLEIKAETVPDEKINKCMILLDYLAKSNEPEITQVIDIFSNALLDDCSNDKFEIDVKKYFNLLFPGLNYSVIYKKQTHLNKPIMDFTTSDSAIILPLKSKTIPTKGPNSVRRSSQSSIGKVRLMNTQSSVCNFINPIGQTGSTGPEPIGATGSTVALVNPTGCGQLMGMVLPNIIEKPCAYSFLDGKCNVASGESLCSVTSNVTSHNMVSVIIEPKQKCPDDLISVPLLTKLSEVKKPVAQKSVPQAVGTLVSPQILEQQRTNLKKVNVDSNKLKIIDNFFDNKTKTETTKSETTNNETQQPKLVTAVCDYNVSVTFYDEQKEIFTKINYDTDLLNTVLADICIKYKLQKVSAVPIFTDKSKTLDSIKNDSTFLPGPFLFKVNNNIYNLYEKVEMVEVVKGYVYNSSKTIVEVKHIGKYGILFV